MKTSTRTRRRSVPRTFAELVTLHAPRPICDDVDLKAAEEVVEQLATLARRNQDQEDYLEVLTTMIEKYESEHFRGMMQPAGAVESLKYLMEQRNMSASDLGRVLGDRPLGPKVLSGARQLSKSHIRALASYFKVNPGLFLGK